MRIQFEFLGDLCVMRLEGRFMTGSDEHYVEAKEELERKGCRKVIVDCRRLSYLDSTGLGFVVGLYNKLKSSGGQFALVRVNTRVRDILALTRLEDYLPIYENQEAAIAALTAPETAACSSGVSAI